MLINCENKYVDKAIFEYILNPLSSKRETNERFNRYLRMRFLATRLQNHVKVQCVIGFVGLM
jgi:hypothetical protein